MNNDPWLDKWLDLIKQKSTGGLILELGCGSGWDTVELLRTGYRVIATDLSTGNLSAAKSAAPLADNVRLDHSHPLPLATASVDVMVASLTLHYFSWNVTMQIGAELKRCLKTDSMLLARFNSTNDVHYGASSGNEIEPHFYQVGTHTKRFFDEASVRSFLQDWDIQFLEENIINRYEQPKCVWEVLAISAD